MTVIDSGINDFTPYEEIVLHLSKIYKLRTGITP
jgi:hypothetical protein